MRTVTDFNFQGQRALVRVDFNVKLDNHYNVIDDTRIKACLPTINKIINEGGKAILMSHMGRPKGQYHESFSFKHLVNHLSGLLKTEVRFYEDCIGDDVIQKINNELQEGKVALLENLRFHKAEKQGDESFAKQLAELGDVYIDDAFGTAHRAHASNYTVAQYFDPEHKMAGSLMTSELEHAHHVVNTPEHPYTAIIGGSKVSDKIQLIRSLMSKADHILIGGGMTYTFLKAQGYQIGNSMVEEDKLELASSLINEAASNHVKLHVPIDSVITKSITNKAEKHITDNSNIPEGYMGADLGPKTIERYGEIIKSSKTIFWNGPVGVFEVEGLEEGTHRMALAVAEATQMSAYSLIGGGDTAAAFDQFNLANQASYVSTGGGALLTYIAGKPLSALAALESKHIKEGEFIDQ